MAARASMENLITRLRRLIGDPDPPVPAVVNGVVQTITWSDEELQDELDARRTFARDLCLTGISSRTASGTVYLEYAAPYGDWEEDAVLKDATFATVEPDGSDYLAGRWTFEEEPDYPLYLTGQSYDLHGTAATVLEQWAATKKLDYYFAAHGEQFSRQQVHDHLLKQAAACWAKARVACASMARNDVR